VSDLTGNELDGAEHRSDRSLLRRFRSGEEDAATQLFLRYASRLRALATSQTSPVLAPRFDADDVVQSVFRTFFRRASSGLYDVPEGDELWQLLLVLSLNKIRSLGSFHRAQKRDVSKTHQVMDSSADGVTREGASENEASMHILELVVQEFLDQLPPIHATVARMRMEGYQVEEISQATQRSKRTIERILAELRQQLVSTLDLPTES
jgi:RNA polymerase sigma-70 factor, ECF subfamily